MFSGIQNKTALASTPLREKALAIIEAGLRAVDTTEVITQGVRVEEGRLFVGQENPTSFDLSAYRHIHIIGFGKASCEAAAALERVLGDQLSSGVVIGIDKGVCEVVETFAGTHPKPSVANVEASTKVVELAREVGKEDLVLVVVSGGGSALLCFPESECQQGQALYDEFVRAGAPITELNTARKHLSELKGGGLAKLLYPATVVGLIFSDVPAGRLSDVASGPTFFDESRLSDVQRILERYRITTDFSFTETPKEEKYFQRVTNREMVSNTVALEAMALAARFEGLEAVILSEPISGSPEEAMGRLREAFPDGAGASAVIAGGEISLEVTASGGSGGRNLYLANMALSRLISAESGSPATGAEDGAKEELWSSIASDGWDNSPAAGALADLQTLAHCKEKNLDPGAFLKAFDSQTLFEQSGDTVLTGRTGANVADLLLALRL